MIYKKGKNPVINPIKVDEIETLFLAENVPSGAALCFTEETEARLRRSHIVLESPNMGLLMRYVLEKEFKTEIDFSSDVTIDHDGKTE